MRYSILLLFLLFIVQSSHAQDKDESWGYDLLVGAKVGLNFNKINGENWQDEYSTNPNAGLFVALNGKRWGIQVEGLWTMNTMVTDTSFAGLYNQYFNATKDSVATGKFTFHSFSIPVLVNYKLSQVLWLQAGPQYNSLIEVLDKDDLIKSGKTVFRKGSMSAVGGLWLNIGRVGPIPKFNIGGRYIFGINNLNELGDESKWRNQRIQVHVGLGF